MEDELREAAEAVGEEAVEEAEAAKVLHLDALELADEAVSLQELADQVAAQAAAEEAAAEALAVEAVEDAVIADALTQAADEIDAADEGDAEAGSAE